MNVTKLLRSCALALLIFSSAAYAQTADLDNQQKNLDGLNAQLQSAQQSQLELSRADQLNRESFNDQSSEITEQALESQVARLQAQIALENQRATRQEEELKKIAELQTQIADASKKLHEARVAEFNKQVAAQRTQLEAVHKTRIAELNAQAAEQQKELDALQAQMSGAPAPAPEPEPAPAAKGRGR